MKKKNPVVDFLRNPLSQIIIFVVIVALIEFLSMAGLISSSFVQAVGNTMIYAIIAIGFCLLLGYSGLASLGTGGFIGIGAYVAFYVIQEFNLPYIVALLAAIVASIVIGVVVGFISLRIEGIYLAILTLGLSEIIRNLLMVIKSTVKIDVDHVRLFGLKIGDQGAYFLILFTFALLMWLLSNLINSPTGRAMLAMKNSTSAAQAMGISLMKFRLLAFVISIIFAGIGGVLYMMFIRTITTSTSTLLTLTTSLNILGAVIIGGAKSLWGTTFGVFIIYGLQAMFLSKIPFFVENPAFIILVTGVLIIVVVMFFPGGFAQIASQVTAKIKSKRAQGGKEAA
ncbi:MAG TPA: branched-chain amino acid ABC transporter permease [Candidatus Galloscillospira stercoripullorum]|nr:branched-chain amino acid ABC transporter permease [Candidatus Galloscillospira stercoripullorum]